LLPWFLSETPSYLIDFTADRAQSHCPRDVLLRYADPPYTRPIIA